VTISGRGRIDEGGENPTIRGRIISTAGICNIERFIHTAPDDHFAASTYCRVTDPAERNVGEPRRRPIIGVGIVPAAGVQRVRAITSAPHNHFVASPQRTVDVSSNTCVRSAGRLHPSIGSRIVYPAGIKMAVTTAANSTPN